jgi:hypothetical protein
LKCMKYSWMKPWRQTLTSSWRVLTLRGECWINIIVPSLLVCFTCITTGHRTTIRGWLNA